MAAAFRSLSFTELMEQKNLDMPDRLKQESEQQYHHNIPSYHTETASSKAEEHNDQLEIVL
jgi:hypothetical protein